MATWADLSQVPTEDTHTAAHEFARFPQHWHSPDSESTESEVSELVGALVRALQPEFVVETGTAFGYTALEIGKALKANGHGQLISLEVDRGRLEFAYNLISEHATWEPYERIIELREQSSLEFVPHRPIDFAWFDSLYELRAEEFKRFRRLGALKPGTIVGFHDTTSGIRRHYLDVSAEVTKLEQKRLLKAIRLRTPRGLALAEVL